MSSQISTILIVGILLAIVIPWAARKKGSRAYWLTELYLAFIRKHIVRVAAPDGGEPYVHYTATLFALLLGCNLAGLVPLAYFNEPLRLENTPIGGTAAGSLYVCGALALMTLVLLLVLSYAKVVVLLRKGPHEEMHLPEVGVNLWSAASHALQLRKNSLPVAVVGGLLVWLDRLVPALPGVTGLLLWPGLLVMEVVGIISRCFALCIRLFANLTAGHMLLAVLVGFMALGHGWSLAYISLPTAVAGVGIMLLETMVAVLQAYLFTLLSALFIGMAVSPPH